MTEELQLPVGRVPGDWKVLSLKEVTSKIGSGSTPRGGASVYVEVGASFIRSQNVLDHGFSSDGLVRINEEAAYSLRGVEVRKGDVLINITGDSILRTCIVPDEVLPARVSQHVAILRSNGLIEPQVLQKWLSLEVMKDFMLGHSSGGTRKAVTKGDLERFPVPVPPLAEQRAIAGVLGALDDKIESNRKLAGTLREYGQALLSQVMLQNSTFSPLRSVVASVARGVAPSYVEDSESPLVLNQRCIRNGRVELSAARRMSHRTVTPERLAQQGDVLVNSTGTGTLGRVARWNGNTVFVDGHVSVVKPDAEKFSPTVLAYLLLSCQTEIEELAEGSTGQTELSPKRLLDFQIAMPKAINAEKVEPELLDLELRGEKALQESDALEMLRDALLPELLSGRLRVKDAESMMENV